MRTGERGYVLILVLILMALGTLMVIPTLQLAFASLRAKQVNTQTFTEQYARDGAAEYAVWELLWGGATTVLTETDDTETYTVTLNGIDVEVVIKMRTELGTSSVPGAEDNSIRITQSVECDEEGDGGFEDDCTTLPKDVETMVARYTISLTQIGPDLVPLEYMYQEYPEKFEYRPGTLDSPDSSFPEISSVTPTNIGSSQNQIWKWDFSAAPVTFVQDEVKTFTFEADIPKDENLYCNGVFLKLQQPPSEKANKQ